MIDFKDQFKNILPIIEGLIVLIIFQVVGGQYFLKIIYKILPDKPLIVLQLASSSAISPLAAILYMYLRIRSYPKVILNKRIFGAAFIGVIGSWFIVFLESLLYTRDSILMSKIMELKSVYLYISIFLIVVLIPLMEETLFRGYFLEALLRKYNTVFAVTMSALFFVIPHLVMYMLWGNIQFGRAVFLFMGAIVLAIVYIEGGLIASFLTHSFVNYYITYIYI